MEYFQPDVNAPITELEKSCLTSGKIYTDLARLTEFITYCPSHPRHIQLAIAAAIIAMQRINRQFGSIVFQVQSIPLATSIIQKQPRISFSTSENNDLLTDLHAFKGALKTNTPLQLFLAPRVVVFGPTGDIRSDVMAALSNNPSRTILCMTISIGVNSTKDAFTINVCCNSDERAFFEAFYSYLRVDPNTIPVINYTQCEYSSMVEE